MKPASNLVAGIKKEGRTEARPRDCYTEITSTTSGISSLTMRSMPAFKVVWPLGSHYMRL
jgi:hypothetical protein